MIFGVARAFGSSCQFLDSFERRLGQHVYRATPAPVAFSATRQVHAGVRPGDPAHSGAEPWPVRPRTTMPGGSLLCDLAAFTACALDNSKPFAVGFAAKLRTSRASCRYHGFPYRQLCLHYSFQEDTDCPSDHRRRTGEPLCRADRTDLEARVHQM
jgi:hypothetical protein